MERMAFATARSGSADSAAAMVTISAPVKKPMQGTTAARTAPMPAGREAAVGRQIPRSGRGLGPQAQQIQRAEEEEDDDRHDLDGGEPVLELAVGAGRDHVRGGEQGQQDQAHGPQRCLWQPQLDQPPARDRLHGHHDHEEVPVQPADGEAGPAAESFAYVGVEGAERRAGDRHLRQHPHDQYGQGAGRQEGQHGGGAGGAYDHTAADEQARADHSAQRDEIHMAALEALVRDRRTRRRGRPATAQGSWCRGPYRWTADGRASAVPYTAMMTNPPCVALETDLMTRMWTDSPGP
jgi:hypothetical protein